MLSFEQLPPFGAKHLKIPPSTSTVIRGNTVLSVGTNYFSAFYKIKLGNFVELGLFSLNLEVTRLTSQTKTIPDFPRRHK